MNQIFTYYHLSKDYLGLENILIPKIPKNSIKKREGNIPRICFSSNIFYCVRAICGNNKLKVYDLAEFRKYNEKKEFLLINPSIYLTKNKLFLPPECMDFRYNKEYWSLESTFVTFIGFLCLNSLLTKEIVITNNNHTLDTIKYLQNMNKRIYIPKNSLL